MKKTRKALILLPVLLSFGALVSCSTKKPSNPSDPDTPVNPDKPDTPDPKPDPKPEKIEPILPKPFIDDLTFKKNYTYTYSYYAKETDEKEFSKVYEYQDRYTKYGMRSKAIFETSTTSQEIGWAVNEKDGAFRVSFDENNNLVPGMALRDENRNKVSHYDENVDSLNNLFYDSAAFKLHKRDNNYLIKDNDEITKILIEASQVSMDKAATTNKELHMDFADKKHVKIDIKLGKNIKIEGEITNVGTTEIPEIKTYLDAGKGALIQTTVDPKLQQIIDTFNDYNYATYIYSDDVIAGEREVIGLKKVYKKASADNQTSVIAVYDDYDEEKAKNKTDKGLIEITKNSQSTVYHFTVSPEGNLVLGEEYTVSGKPAEHLDDYYILPTSLSMFNEDAIYLQYDPKQDKFATFDTYISIETCGYFGFASSVAFSTPYCAGVSPFYNETNEITSINLNYWWQVNDTKYIYDTYMPYFSFGKINLPFVDAYLGGL